MGPFPPVSVAIRALSGLFTAANAAYVPVTIESVVCHGYEAIYTYYSG